MERVSHLVLLPGLDGTGQLFAPLLKALAPHVRTTVVSYPATDALEADALLERICAALPREPFVVVGESFSGPLALRLAAQAPQTLRGVVLVASFVSSPVRWLPPVAASLGLPLFARAPPKRVLRALLLDAQTPAALVDDVAAAVSSVAPRVLAGRVAQVLRVNVSGEAARCPVPLLYLAGARDRLVGPQCLEALRSAQPRVEVTTLDAPHLVLQTQPAQSARRLEQFLSAL